MSDTTDLMDEGVLCSGCGASFAECGPPQNKPAPGHPRKCRQCKSEAWRDRNAKSQRSKR